MYKITINYDNYVCANHDLLEVISTLQKMRKLENGKQNSINFSVEEIGSSDNFAESEIARLTEDVSQKQKWWLDERNKVTKLEARIKELENQSA